MSGCVPLWMALAAFAIGCGGGWLRGFAAGKGWKL